MGAPRQNKGGLEMLEHKHKEMLECSVQVQKTIWQRVPRSSEPWQLCIVANRVFKKYVGVLLNLHTSSLLKCLKIAARRLKSVYGISGGYKVNKVHPLLLKEERHLIQALWLKPSVSQGNERCICGHKWLQTAYDCSLQLFCKAQWCRRSNYFCSWIANKLLIACSLPRVGVVSLLV